MPPEAAAAAPGGTSAIRFRLNGEPRSLDLAPDMRLADLLRDRFGLTAAKTACGIGRCGACLVLVDGRPLNACLVMAWQIDGTDVLSPEGLDALPVAGVVRAALAEAVAFQCGYCAPGFVTALTALFLEEPQADDAAIRDALSGNLCRCTGYHSILRGAFLARRRLQASTADPAPG